MLLAHGAGSDMHGAALAAVADALAAASSRRCGSTTRYRSAGKRAPDSPKVLEAATREAAAELARRAKLAARAARARRSLDGWALLLARRRRRPTDPLPALGLLFLAYPLHAAGKPDQPRVEHFPRLTVPVLFVSGTRDSLPAKPALTRAARAIRGPVAFHWIDTADHGYRPLKSSGRTTDDVLAEVAEVSADWVSSLR